MKEFFLKNENVEIKVQSLGAQLCSIKKGGREYLWCADPAVWKWHSPILFPFVGRLKNFEYTYRGIKYQMPQHGFAREMEFELESKNESEIWFKLGWNEETLKKYPFKFVLHAGFELDGNKIKVMWRVENEGAEEMYFSIGGHPAFNCPIEPHGSMYDCWIDFHAPKIDYFQINQDGLYLQKKYELSLENGKYKIAEDTFDNDALIIKTEQTKKISLCAPDKSAYVTVEFDSPLVGVYSPKCHAPYVCIEPWYGRCDAADFEGDLSEREYMQKLPPHGEFKAEYAIEV